MVPAVVTIPLPGQPLDQPAGADRQSSPPQRVEEFFAGPENPLAVLAIGSVFDDAAGIYNPLLLYGPSGTGKTHLALGVQRAWKARYGRRRRVQYTTAVDFGRELAEAIDSQAVGDFRQKYRGVWLLIVEDLQHLEGKTFAQTELLHTLDALLAIGSRVVATANAAAAELPGIAPALRGRLAGGLMVPLMPPGPETRLAVLQRLACLRGVSLAEPVAKALAAGLAATVPQLLGALRLLEVRAARNGGQIDIALVHSLLAERSASMQPPLKEIALPVARYFCVTLSELRGSSRRRMVVIARDVAMYLARELTDQSLKQIGLYFGGRDHTTVMHGCRKTKRLIETDPALREAVRQLHQNWHTG